MQIKDASSIVNELYLEMTGTSDISQLDSMSIVDIGKKLASFTTADIIYQKLSDKVGRIIVRNKKFKAKFMNLYRDGWEYGSIMEQAKIKPYTASTDLSRKPVSSFDYSSDLNTLELGDVIVSYYNKFDTFRIKYSKPNDQLWGAFNSWEDMTRFLSAIEVEVSNAVEKRLQGLAKTAINNMIAQTIHKDFPTPSSEGYNANSYSRSINVLKLYNTAYGTSLTPQNCRQNADFLKFFVKTVLNTKDRLTDISTLFNVAGEDTFTREEDINTIVLSTVANDVKVNMQSDVYHKELVELPNYETVPYWQASGLAYDESVISEVNCKIESGDTTADVEISGVLAVMFDKNAVGITCEKKKTTTNYIANVDCTNFYEVYEAQYFNQLGENFVVFYVA